MTDSKIDLRPWKHWLQPGEIAEIRSEVGVKKAQGSNILAGRSKNLMFVQKFFERVARNKAVIEKIESL